MRIFFLTANDSIFLPGFFRKVFSGLDDEIVAVGVVSDPGFRKFLWKSLSFMGPLLFISEIMRQVRARISNLVSSLLGRPAEHSLKAACGQFGIPFVRIANINSREFREHLISTGVDLIISVSCPQILRKKILSTPEFGCINVHYGLLPDYRGMYPSFWVLANGEEKTGVSVHYMVEKVDAGDILVQIEEPIRNDDTFYSLVGRLKSTIGPRALISAVRKIKDHDLSITPNDPGRGNYYSVPSRKDFLRFRQMGRKWY